MNSSDENIVEFRKKQRFFSQVPARGIACGKSLSPNGFKDREKYGVNLCQ